MHTAIKLITPPPPPNYDTLYCIEYSPHIHKTHWPYTAFRAECFFDVGVGEVKTP